MEYHVAGHVCKTFYQLALDKLVKGSELSLTPELARDLEKDILAVAGAEDAHALKSALEARATTRAERAISMVKELRYHARGAHQTTRNAR